jgi:hypothetical protein
VDGPTRDPQPAKTSGSRGFPWEQLEFPQLTERPGRRIRANEPVEYKVVTLRDCPLPESLRECDSPQKAADYWRLHVATTPNFNPDVETFVVLHLNTRRRVRGHHVVATGTLDTVITHSREVYRTAITTTRRETHPLQRRTSVSPATSSARASS